MPNWCENVLTITGNDKQVKAFKKKAFTAKQKNALDFCNFFSASEPEKNNLDWQRDHFGCKWGANNPGITLDEPEKVEYFFDSAWGPPVEFIVHVSKMYPDLKFSLFYHEPGMCFIGDFVVKNNQVLEDTCYEGDAYRHRFREVDPEGYQEWYGNEQTTRARRHDK